MTDNTDLWDRMEAAARRSSSPNLQQKQQMIDISPADRKANSTSVSDISWAEADRINATLEGIFEDVCDYQTSCTDMPSLNRWDSHYVFVYNQLKKGFAKDRQLTGYPCVAVGWTLPIFRMFRHKSRYGFPVILLGDKEESAPVYGEIYQVPPSKLRILDWAENNQFMTRRIKIPIKAVIDTKGNTETIKAWTYIHMRNYWDSRSEQLEPIDVMTANNGGKKYYSFLKKFENQPIAA